MAKKNIFTEEEVSWATDIHSLILLGILHFPKIKEQESLFLIDRHLNWIDVSKNRRYDSVEMMWSVYSKIDYPHVLIHNHPINGIYPSDGDWQFDHMLKRRKYPCVFQMIISGENLQWASMFQLKRKVTKLYLPLII